MEIDLILQKWCCVSFDAQNLSVNVGSPSMGGTIL